MSRFGKFKQSAMQRGGKSLLKVAIYIIVLLVSLYGDGVFVWMNIGHYTGQYAVIFQIFLVLGAICTSSSIMCLLFGKESWFTPGVQLKFAYIFTGVEIAVNVLNIVVALSPNLGLVDLWLIVSPATPFVALIGWVVILQLDEEQKERHAQMEAEQEKRDAEREYEMMVHDANMELKVKYLEQTKQRLHQELNSPFAQQVVSQHAQNLTAQVLNEITGLPVMQQQPTLPPAVPQSQNQTSDGSVNKERMYDADEVKRYTAESVDRVAAYYERKLQELQSRPLATAPLEVQDSQPGTNGKH